MVQLFASNIEAWTFYLVYSLWLLSEVVGAGVIPRLRRRGTQIKRKDNSSYGLIMMPIFVSVYIAFAFASSGIARWPSWVFYPGIVLMVLGILLRQWSIVVLGRFFSSMVAIQEGQKVVDSGPYRLVRHPSYTGAFLIFMGQGLALQSWGAILLLVLTFGLAYGYRIYVEEKVLISELGDDYVKYSKRTKRLIPYVL
ncbi:MAG: isoprenylcysteine carboxylmethyltransferase family protein [Halobacteriota archaeon]